MKRIIPLIILLFMSTYANAGLFDSVEPTTYFTLVNIRSNKVCEQKEEENDIIYGTGIYIDNTCIPFDAFIEKSLGNGSQIVNIQYVYNKLWNGYVIVVKTPGLKVNENGARIQISK